MITKKDIRNQLPGFKVETPLAGEFPYGKRMTVITTFSGFLDELFSNTGFRVYSKGQDCKLYNTIQEAWQAWEES
jgi:hypothetical protein